MRRLAALTLLFAPAAVLADDLWLSGAVAESGTGGQRFAVSRTLDSYGLPGTSAGVSRFQFGSTRWTLFDAGVSRRIGESFFASGSLHFGPGRINDEAFMYRKLSLDASWQWSQRWSLAFGDTYVNVADAVGHVVSASLTHSMPSGFSATLHGITSASSAIVTREAGIKLRLQRRVAWFGGVYAGETRNPVLLSEVGGTVDTVRARLRQAYVGIGVPVGDCTVQAVFDYLRLHDMARRELSVVLQVPLGSGDGS